MSFTLCASGAFSIPAFFILHALGYQGTELGNTIGPFVLLLAIAETICLPVDSIFFYKIEPSLALLGIVGFLVVLCAGLGFPALG